MILGITGDFEKGKRSILNSLISEKNKIKFDYEPLPPQFEKYSKKDITRYFEQISKSQSEGKIVLIDEIENIKQFNSFKQYFKDDFKTFSVRLSPSVKYLNYVKQKVKKGINYLNRKPFQEFRDDIENKNDNYSKLLDMAEMKIESASGSTKSLDSMVLDYIENHNK